VRKTGWSSRCEFLCSAGLLLGEKPREAPTYHQFRRDFGGPDTEVKPFENQINNERETSRISLHDFNELEDHRLRGFLNVIKDEDDEPERLRELSDHELIVTIVTSVTGEFWVTKRTVTGQRASCDQCDGCDDFS